MEMKLEARHEKIRIDFEASPFFQLLGFHLVEVSEEDVILELPIEKKLYNTYGNLHGGALATIIDNIIGMKMRAVFGQPVITIDLHTQYIASVRGGTISARANVYGNGRKIKMGDAEVFDQEGNLLAKGYGTFKMIKEQ